MTRSLHHPPDRRSATRSALMRTFALLVALLALSAQQHVVRVVRLLPAAATRVVRERSQTIESNALRVEAPPNGARARTLVRLPVLSAPVAGSRLPRAVCVVPRVVGVRCAQVVTHFHAKRRIPRMNSEEPPRALS